MVISCGNAKELWFMAKLRMFGFWPKHRTRRAVTSCQLLDVEFTSVFDLERFYQPDYISLYHIQICFAFY